jgi:hypothetical protein
MTFALLRKAKKNGRHLLGIDAANGISRKLSVILLRKSAFC